MCTAINLVTKDHYFGRNLDLEYHYEENVVVIPRRFPFPFRRMPDISEHAAFIGMATMAGGYPLLYDATNEYGVSMAGLNFPSSAVYRPFQADMDNVTPFEFIPYVLSQCQNMAQVRALLPRVNLLDENFSGQMPLSPLHWMIIWRDESLVAEPCADGLRVYDNPVGVMTNNPSFDMHLWNLNNYMALSPEQPENRLAPGLPLKHFSNGMGALGLPGDLSSASRFVRAAYTKLHSQCGPSEEESVSQFFHILGTVAHTRGSVMAHGRPEITVYSSCCNTDAGIYYYTTYDNSRITAVHMHREDLDAAAPIVYPLITRPDIYTQN